MYWVAVESMATAERDVRAMVSQIPSLRKKFRKSPTLAGESPTSSTPTGSDLMAAVAQWLRHIDRRGWLLVLDNADDKEVLSKVVSLLLPPLSGGASTTLGHVMVTSRLSSAQLESVMPGIRAQTLEALSLEDAEALLWEQAYGRELSSELSRRGLTQESEAAAIRVLAGLSGVAGLPLALTHAAGAVRKGTTFMSYASYLHAFRLKRTALFADAAAVSSSMPMREWLAGCGRHGPLGWWRTWRRRCTKTTWMILVR